MFTEGLDETALNWVREGVDVQPTLYSSENISPNLASDPLIYNAASIGKAGNWGLPSTKLPPIHYRSGFLGPPLISTHLEGSVVLDVDDDESVGSAPEHGLYYSSGEDGDSVESDLQEDPLLHHGYIGGAGHGVYMTGDPKPSQETTYEYNCRYRYDRLQKSSPDPVSVLESRSGHGGAKRNVDPTQHGESLAASSEDIGSPEELPRENEENSTFYREEKCAQPTTGFVEKRQEDKEEFHIPEPQPRSLSETGTPSAPPMFAPENEITEESALKTESNNSWRQSSRKSSPLHDIHTDQKHFSVPEPNDKCTGSSCEEGEVQTSCRQTNSFLSPPTFYVSGHGAWQAFLAYEACIRLCLRAWATGCMEAPEFLNDECAVLRNAFGLQKVLLQPEEELLMTGPISSSMEETTAPRHKKTVEKIKVEVHRVKIKRVVPSKCNFPCAGPILEHFKSLRKHFSNMRSSLSAGWAAMKTVHVVSNAPHHSTYSQRGAAYMQAGAQYVRQLSGIIKAGVNTLCNSKPSETTQETFSCLLQLKSLIEEEASLMQPGSSVWMQPGSGDNHMFFPESQGDVLIVEVQDCKGNAYGRSWIKISSITDDPNDKIRWWPIYNEKHECVGKVQLSITNINTSGEMRSTKCGPVGETLAYDLVLEAAMRMQCFQSRNLRLHGPWKWLLAEFASYYGVSDSYTKLRYLSCIMDVATPTKDCFDLLYELLVPIIKARDENTLNRQEKRMLVDSEDQLEHLLAMAFENYKSLEESSPSGLADMFGPATGIAAPALAPAVQVYTLLHDILSPDAQATLRNYIQMAARKRCKRHMAETDEFLTSNNDGFLMDSLTTSTAYLKMKALCMHIRDEVHTDIAIHNKHILPSCIDLPNITAGVYNLELCNRLRAFLVACPPSSPSTPVIELLIATADFQRDLASWNICPIKGGVDSKELFHLYIVLWIQDKRLYLLDFCKLEKVRLIETQTMTQHSTSPFVEEMYERIKDTLNEYEAIINRWPEYSIDLENAITTVERAVMRALEKQYSEVLTPLKAGIIPKKFGLQYMQKLARRNSVCLYSVPSHLGLFLNTIKRILDALHPKVEIQLRSWASCVLTPVAGDKKLVFGEQLNGITVMLRTKYKTFLQAIVERLADNTHVQRTTKLKRILQDTKEAGGENEIRERMQLLNSQLIETICQLHYMFDSRIFVAICRGFWDRMGQDVLYFLENRKENRSWYKGSCFALGILDDTFASQMQRLQGNALQEKDLDPPRSIMEARSMLCRETPHGADSSNYYYL